MLFPDLLFAVAGLLLLLLSPLRLFRSRSASMRSYGVMFGSWLVFCTSIARPVVIPSGSMEPTLQIGDRLVVDVVGYQVSGAHRGDVLAFRSPEGGEKLLCKRVIGLPGEQLAVRRGRVEINGSPLLSDWSDIASSAPFGPITVPPHSLFMMGDNRNNSYDSRYFGPVSEELVMGRMDLLFWPLNHIRTLHP